MMVKIRTKISKELKLRLTSEISLRANTIAKLAALISSKETMVKEINYPEVMPDLGKC